MEQTRIYWLHTLSPTHVGTGRGVGYIDLPIQRDKVTHWPVIPATAFKGVWADHFRATEENRKTDPKLGLAFGRASDSKEKEANAGALIPTDARLVCLPVRSFRGTFAWCTSPLVLRMLHRDLSLAGMTGLPALPADPEETVVLHPPSSALHSDGRIYLEDLDFTAKACSACADWAGKLAEWVFQGKPHEAWKQRFIERFAVLPDVIFDFLAETGTEVRARVRIQEDLKTVKDGQLWTEEALPAEIILAGLISCDRIYTRSANGVTPASLIRDYATKPLTLQIGGKATVGGGRVRCVFTPVAGGG